MSILVQSLMPSKFSVHREGVSYGSVGLLLALADYPLVVFLPTYHAVELGFGFAVAGAIFFWVRVSDVLTDPLIGWASDKFLWFFGTRKFLVLTAAFAYCLALVVVFQPSASLTPQTAVISLFGFYLLRTLLDVPHAAMGAQLNSNNESALRLFGYRGVFSVVAVLFTASIAFVLGSQTEELLEAISWLAIGLFVPVCWAFQRYVGKEAYALPSKNSFNPSLLKNMFWSPVGRPMIAFFLNQIGNAFAATLVVLYITNILDLEQHIGTFLGSLFAASAISVPVWIFCANRYDSVAVWKVSICICSCTFLVVPFLSSESAIFYWLACVLAGSCFGADAVLPPAIIGKNAIDPENVDLNSNVAMVFSIKSMFSKLSLTLPVMIAFPILQLVGFTDGDANSTTSDGWLVFLYALFPVVFKISAFRVLRYSH